MKKNERTSTSIATHGAAESTVRHISTAPSSNGAGTATSTETPTDTTDAEPTGQMTLLTVEPDTRARRLPTTAAPRRDVHARFRLSKQTREIGLRHVAEIRRQLDESRARTQAGAETNGGRPAA